MASWIIIVEWASRLILFGLIGLSIWSIAIIIERRKYFQNLENSDNNKEILNWIRQGQRDQVLSWAKSHQGMRAGTVLNALDRQSSEQMEKAVFSYWSQQRTEMEKNLSVLGTLGSTTPFIGLLGTILGIIVAFGALSTGQIDSQKIMYALAEALILTAVGLGVAIPSVVSYNYFTRRLAALQRDCDSIKDLIISYFSK